MAKNETINAVTQIISGYINDKDLELYNIEYKKEGQIWKLKVFIEKSFDAEEEYVNIEECEALSRYLSEELDNDEIICRNYTLEVSSPGMDRELIKESDFSRFRGKSVEVKLYEPLEGSKFYTGELLGMHNNNIDIIVDDKELSIPKEKVSKINLAVIF